MTELHWAKEEEHVNSGVSGVQKHKGVQKAAYSMLSAYLRSCIKTRHLRIEDRVKAVLLAM